MWRKLKYINYFSTLVSGLAAQEHIMLCAVILGEI